MMVFFVFYFVFSVCPSDPAMTIEFDKRTDRIDSIAVAIFVDLPTCVVVVHFNHMVRTVASNRRYRVRCAIRITAARFAHVPDRIEYARARGVVRLKTIKSTTRRGPTTVSVKSEFSRSIRIACDYGPLFGYVSKLFARRFNLYPRAIQTTVRNFVSERVRTTFRLRGRNRCCVRDVPFRARQQPQTIDPTGLVRGQRTV